jgi:hypothetical protein
MAGGVQRRKNDEFAVIMLLVRIEDEREARSREQHTEKYAGLQFPEFMFVARNKICTQTQQPVAIAARTP